MSDIRNLVSTERIAEVLDYSPWYVRTLANSGAIPGVKKGKSWFFDEREVVAVNDPRTTKPNKYRAPKTEDPIDDLCKAYGI